MNQLDIRILRDIKRLAILAMISDDDLMELLIFKGGSAIDMIYGITDRASLDLDFSMENGLTQSEEYQIGEKIKKALENTFMEAGGYLAYDIKFQKRPRNLLEDWRSFWGGYQIEFKVILKEKADKYNEDISRVRNNSLTLGKEGSKKFTIDISSYEYCATKEAKEFEDYMIYVYTPEMIVFEKLRAICQQLPDYQKIIKTNQKPRGRDFYDIRLLMDQFSIDPSTKENKDLIKNIFNIKRVPLDYIQEIRAHREFHRENFEASLKDTVSIEEEIKSFDDYFDYVIEQFNSLEF